MSLNSIIKKWYVIFLCALLGAGGLYFEKKNRLFLQFRKREI